MRRLTWTTPLVLRLSEQILAQARTMDPDAEARIAPYDAVAALFAHERKSGVARAAVPLFTRLGLGKSRELHFDVGRRIGVSLLFSWDVPGRVLIHLIPSSALARRLTLWGGLAIWLSITALAVYSAIRFGAPPILGPLALVGVPAFYLVFRSGVGLDAEASMVLRDELAKDITRLLRQEPREIG